MGARCGVLLWTSTSSPKGHLSFMNGRVLDEQTSTQLFTEVCVVDVRVMQSVCVGKLNL